MTASILVVLIILCICNMAMVAFCVTKVCNTLEILFFPKHLPLQENEPSKAPEVSPEEMEAARRKFNAEMEAFQELMNYNQDTAYGIKPSEE